MRERADYRMLVSFITGVIVAGMWTICTDSCPAEPNPPDISCEAIGGESR